MTSGSLLDTSETIRIIDDTSGAGLPMMPGPSRRRRPPRKRGSPRDVGRCGNVGRLRPLERRGTSMLRACIFGHLLRFRAKWFYHTPLDRRLGVAEDHGGGMACR